MDLKKLDAFRSIARYGSLGRAATRQGLTLSALSIQLKKLEADLGVQLFEHLPNKLVLTNQGRLFLKEVNRIFEILERAKAVLSEPQDNYPGTVSISLATDLAKVFAPCIARFVHAHPKLNVAIMAKPSRETMAMVVNGDIDIGVGFFRTAPRGILRTKIGGTEIALVLPRGHSLLRKKKVTLDDIAEHRVILRRRTSTTRRIIDSVLDMHGVHLNNVLEVARCQSAMDYVELGLGVGLVHTICARAELHKGLAQVDMSHYFDHTEVAIATRAALRRSAAHQALVQTVTDEAQAFCAPSVGIAHGTRRRAVTARGA